MQMLFTVFFLPFLNLHNDNRLTRPQNEVQISSVCTFGPARPLIPACSSQILVFPVYRRNGEEYSPQYPHHWGVPSHSRAVDKPKEPHGELRIVFYTVLPLFNDTNSRGQQWLFLLIPYKKGVGMRTTAERFTCSTSVGRFFRPLGCRMARCRKLHPDVSFFFRSAPIKTNRFISL